ncbi:TPA: hypothetical protein ACHKM1_003081, partial [Enterococcus faecium]
LLKSKLSSIKEQYSWKRKSDPNDRPKPIVRITIFLELHSRDYDKKHAKAFFQITVFHHSLL